MTRVSKLVLAAFALVTLAACGGHHHYSQKHPEKAYRFVSHRVDSVLDDLDASEAQRERIHGVKDRVYGDMKSVRESARQAGRTALAELKKQKPDPKKLHALVDQRMDDLRDKMHGLADGLLEVHGTLSPEQRAELVAMIEERLEDHDAR